MMVMFTKINHNDGGYKMYSLYVIHVNPALDIHESKDMKMANMTPVSLNAKNFPSMAVFKEKCTELSKNSTCSEVTDDDDVYLIKRL
jgi:hypothetical protein